MLRIELDDLSRAPVLGLLEEHLRDMYQLSPPDQVFAFDASKLPAQTLYRSAGFAACGPFGSYRDNGNSVFMSLRLA
jgi:hypothetical protein